MPAVDAARGRQLAQLERGGAGLEADDHQGEAGVAFCSKPRRTCTPGAASTAPSPPGGHRQGERP